MSVIEIVREAVSTPEPRLVRAARVAARIQHGAGYRWVGIYERENNDIVALAWTESREPAHRRFPATDGLCGAALRSGETVVVGDVRNDPRYLTTFGDTRSEIIVPVKSRSGSVLGLIDVESDRPNAFTEQDRVLLENCAREMAPLWEQPA